VKIVKDFIDLVSFGNISVTGSGVQIGSFSNGRTPSGTGFLSMNVTVPGGFNVGSNITLNVGSSDRFNLRVVRQGLVTSITANPQPSTIQARTPWTATVSGVDIANVTPAFAAPSCHTTSNLTQSATTVTFTVTRNVSCTTNTFQLGVNPSTSNNDPPKYVTSAGQAPGLGFSYQPIGVACTSVPNMGKTIIRTPSAGQVIVFTGGTPSPANITIRWDSLTLNQQAAPNNEWIVAYTPGNTSGGGLLPGTNGKSKFFTVRGLFKTLPIVIPGTHTVSIQAKNCDVPADVASMSFQTRY
jgi:hypothetical protein